MTENAEFQRISLDTEAAKGAGQTAGLKDGAHDLVFKRRALDRRHEANQREVEHIIEDAARLRRHLSPDIAAAAGALGGNAAGAGFVARATIWPSASKTA